MAPVGDDAAGKFHAATVAAAIVDGQDHVAVGGEKLALELKRIGVEGQAVIVLAVGSAVNPEKSGIFFRGTVGGRLDHHAVDFGAVLAFEGDVFDGAELELGEERVVVSGELAELAVFEGENFRGYGVAGSES